MLLELRLKKMWIDDLKLGEPVNRLESTDAEEDF
jgi:hypothetical protein